MPSVPAACLAYDRPACHDYGPGEFARLAADLEATAAATVPAEVASARSLELDDRGRLPGGLRFAEAAFRQACDAMAPGLFALVRDLAAGDEGVELAPGEADPALALAAYNRVARLRGGRLVGTHRLLIDESRRRVDGVLGPRAVLLGGDAVLAQAAEAADARADRPAFAGATVAGRLVVARFVARAPLVAFGGDRYSSGLYAASGEAGSGAFRCAPLLRRAGGGDALGSDYAGGRGAHVGRGLADRVRRAFDRAAADAPDAAAVAARLARLAAAPLWPPAAPPAERAERRARLVLWLRELGVARPLAARAVDLAAGGGDPVAGAGPEPPGPGGRSYYDLFVALGAVAGGRYGTTREAAERAAARVLDGAPRPG